MTLNIVTSNARCAGLHDSGGLEEDQAAGRGFINVSTGLGDVAPACRRAVPKNISA